MSDAEDPAVFATRLASALMAIGHDRLTAWSIAEQSANVVRLVTERDEALATIERVRKAARRAVRDGNTTIPIHDVLDALDYTDGAA